MHGAAVTVFLYYFFGRVYFRLGVTIFDKENRKCNRAQSRTQRIFNEKTVHEKLGFASH